ncbi:hypothetical protein CVT26_002818, partial [Gymnopilus dilepis]
MASDYAHIYRSYAEVLESTQSVKEDLAAVLDPEVGIEDLEDRADSRNLRDEIEVLQLEQNTWGLLQAVMPARLTSPPHPPPTPLSLLLQNPYTPPSALAQAIVRSSALLTELLVIREWLQETAPNPTQVEATTGYWRVTKATILQGLRTGQGQGKEGVVKEMDPDAVGREGRGLVGDDA